MEYRIVYRDELYHHGVKGMKWGVRKADYNTPGMRSKNIYNRLDDLESQEHRALYENRKNFRDTKKQIRGDAKARVQEAKAANKEAKKEYSKSFDEAAKFSQRHPVTQFIKKSKNYQKSNEKWEDAQKKAEAANAAKKNLKDVKKSAKADIKSGKAAAREVLRKNRGTIERDFDKAYYKTIGENHIKSARRVNAATEIADIMVDRHMGIDHDDSRYQRRKAQLEMAEYRRNRYIESRRG